MKARLAAGLAGVVVSMALVGGGLVTRPSAAAGSGDVTRPLPPTAHAVTAAPPASPLVLISGRDDHGELASPHVEVVAAPGSRVSVGEARDGTLAEVVDVRGTWLRLRTVEGPRLEGWVDDFHLRRELHLVGSAPSCRTTLRGRALPAGEQAVVIELVGGHARVRLVHGGATGWVARASVRELAPREGCGAPDGATASGHGGRVHHH